MAANGRIPTAQLAALPTAFSNKHETEHLTKNAYASLVRMMLRATADTGSFFSVWDAYRSMAEQEGGVDGGRGLVDELGCVEDLQDMVAFGRAQRVHRCCRFPDQHPREPRPGRPGFFAHVDPP